MSQKPSCLQQKTVTSLQEQRESRVFSSDLDELPSGDASMAVNKLETTLCRFHPGRDLCCHREPLEMGSEPL
ncbi:hypothetical protein VULLAG_LOCUS5677 [Vulpes lagopus]